MGINIKHQCSFPLVFLATATLLLAGQATATATATVSDLCAATEYKPLCRATLKGITDPNAAIEASINQVILKSKHAYFRSRTMGNDETTEICKEMYDDAITDLENSLKALKAKDKGTLDSNLSAAISYYSSCDDSYAEMGQESPFS
ncbi:hypothetical protein GH714_038391 [Hevea brasiliensis]|uniref:Pectinesterase inhibitor domain-containing protein n=1 Tax=Hevea brasiliensis TaxID=3981 RepID=A0A6A6LDW5_HEVBR|nr:hypothetical protein GH714_038391 [Hevea brasiliensis]